MKNTGKSKKTTHPPKVLYFDDGEERLDKSIRKRTEEGRPLEALRLTNRRNEFFDPTPDSYAAQADLYETLEVYTQAVKTWYRFLNECDEDSLAEAYEGLAVNYMNLGKEGQSAYYYNQLLRVDDELSEESKMDIVEMFSKPKKEAFRIVYPPEKADYTPEIEQGLRALRESNFSSAREAFSQVAAGSPQYRTAQNLVAVAYLLEDRKEEARALCEKLIAENDGDVQAYTTYAAILGQTEEREKAAAVAKKLSRMYTEDTDELYKIATVCCENGLHAAALEKFIQLEKEMPNDGNLLYFKAVSAYKSGNIPLALDTFDRLLVIYPEAAVARYYYDLLRHYPDHRDKEDMVEPDLTYFYRVPQKVREAYCDMLCFLEGLHVREAEELSDNPQVISVLQWSFDELDGADGDLQMLAMSAAVHCRYERFVEETLLDPDVSDVVKVQTMQLIAEQNKETEYGVVVCHIYRHVRFYRLKINGKKKKKFLHAYAAVFAKFAVVSDNHAQRIRSSAELLYNCLALREATSYADKPENISCAIYLLADIREAGSKPAAAAELFGAEEAEVSEILELVRAVTNEVLRRGRKESPKADEESAAAYAETDAEKKDDGEE